MFLHAIGDGAPWASNEMNQGYENDCAVKQTDGFIPGPALVYKKIVHIGG